MIKSMRRKEPTKDGIHKREGGKVVQLANNKQHGRHGRGSK